MECLTVLRYIEVVELLADTATITLPGAQYNVALDVEDKLHRGDKVIIRFGYKEEALKGGVHWLAATNQYRWWQY